MVRKIIISLFLLPLLCLAGGDKDKSLEKTAVDTLRIHPIGDSITRGKAGDTYRHYVRHRLERELGYEVDLLGKCEHGPDVLADWLDYQDIIDSLEFDLEHDGWGGLKINEIMSTYGNTKGYPEFTIEELLEDFPADIIFLMIGTNDMYSNEKQTAYIRVDTLINKILRNTDSWLIVSSIPPTNNSSINIVIEEYNAKLDSIVKVNKNLDKNILFANPYVNMERSDLLTDGVHPNPSGNKKIADGFYNEVYKIHTGTKINPTKDPLPQGFNLQQNYPNPFNSDTTIKFNIPEKSFVSLRIYDASGKEIKTCISEQLDAGEFSYRLNANDLASGLYFYELYAQNFKQSKKFLLLK